MIRKIFTLLGQELRRAFRLLYYETIPVLLFGLSTYLALKLGYSEFIPKIAGVQTIHWVIPNLIAFTFMIFAYAHAAESLSSKKSSGYLSYLRTTDIPRGIMICIFTIDAVIKSLLKSVILICVYWLLFGSIGEIVPWALFFAAMLLPAVVWALLGIVSGLTIKKPVFNSHLLIGVILPLIVMTGMLYPLTEYPKAMHSILIVLPSSLGFLAGRGILGISQWNPVILLGLAGWVIVSFIISLIILRAERNQ